MTTFTKTQILTTIKHLASGKDAELVADIMKSTKADVIEIARHHGYPDVEKLAWAADILEKKLDEDNQPAERPLVGGGEIVTRPQQLGTKPGTTPITPTTVPPIPRPDELRVMIATAKNHESKRIQAAATRADDAIAKLRQLIVEDEQKNHEKRKAAAAKARAKAEVERLEAELAAARAKLRGSAPAKPKTPASPTPAGVLPTSAEIRAWARDNDVDCPPVGQVPARVREAYDDARTQVAS